MEIQLRLMNNQLRSSSLYGTFECVSALKMSAYSCLFQYNISHSTGLCRSTKKTANKLLLIKMGAWAHAMASLQCKCCSIMQNQNSLQSPPFTYIKRNLKPQPTLYSTYHCPQLQMSNNFTGQHNVEMYKNNINSFLSRIKLIVTIKRIK